MVRPKPMSPSGSHNDYVEYFKVDDEVMMSKFVDRVEEKVEEEEINTIQNFERIVQEAADECLKKKSRRSVDRKGKTEPPWICENI